VELQSWWSSPQVLDTTGCGDAYHGAFLFGLLRGLPLPQTAALASAAAALNGQAFGGRAALPCLPEVEAFLRARVR
jgi:sugar/nucleoside kinase (ribokinase family)